MEITRSLAGTVLDPENPLTKPTLILNA